jgi:hypothetical protein
MPSQYNEDDVDMAPNVMKCLLVGTTGTSQGVLCSLAVQPVGLLGIETALPPLNACMQLAGLATGCNQCTCTSAVQTRQTCQHICTSKLDPPISTSYLLNCMLTAYKPEVVRGCPAEASPPKRPAYHCLKKEQTQRCVSGCQTVRRSMYALKRHVLLSVFSGFTSLASAL